MLHALLAGGVCEGDVREELVAVYRSCFAEQTHTIEVLIGTASAVALSGKGNRTRYLQVTPTKVPATKPRAHAVSHGRTIGGGVWLRPFWSKLFAVWGEEVLRPFKIAVLRGSGAVKLKINAHRRIFDLAVECKN